MILGSKLLEGGYLNIGDYVKDYYRGYLGEYQGFQPYLNPRP